jgi:hypothetical protein
MIFTLNTTHGKPRKLAGIRITPEPRAFCLGRPPAGTDAVAITEEQLEEIKRGITAGASVKMVSLERDEKRAELRLEVARLKGEHEQVLARIAELELLVAARDEELAEQREQLIAAEQRPRPEHALARIAELEQAVASREAELAEMRGELKRLAGVHEGELEKLRAEIAQARGELAQERARRKK